MNGGFTLHIRTIVTDLDDTLLNGDACISAYTLGVLKQVMDRGIDVVLASGRAGASMRAYVDQVASPVPYIACNGGEIISAVDHQVLDGLCFTPDMARECVRFAKGNGFYVHLYEEDAFYYEGNEEYGMAYAHSSNLKGIRVNDLEKYIRMPTPKLLCVGEPEKIATLLVMARERFGDAVAPSISKPFFLELTPPGATKGGALTRLQRYVPIDPETTMAFGDSLNDLSMLQWAKYGVVMENGRTEIRDTVPLVCPPNTEDGVARFIATHVLKEDVTP